jgi:hypothetical protein
VRLSDVENVQKSFERDKHSVGQRIELGDTFSGSVGKDAIALSSASQSAPLQRHPSVNGKSPQQGEHEHHTRPEALLAQSLAHRREGYDDIGKKSTRRGSTMRNVLAVLPNATPQRDFISAAKVLSQRTGLSLAGNGLFVAVKHGRQAVTELDHQRELSIRDAEIGEENGRSQRLRPSLNREASRLGDVRVRRPSSRALVPETMVDGK